MYANAHRFAIFISTLVFLTSGESRAQVLTQPTPRNATAERSKEIRAQDLVGIWEAIDVRSLRLFVADIHEQVYESFVSMVTTEALVFSVHSLTTRGHHVDLLCDGQGNASAYSLKIAGDGWAGAGQGVLEATVVLRDSDGKRIYNTWHVSLYGFGDKLVRAFYQAKLLSDEAIAAARAHRQTGAAPAPGQ